MNPYCISVEETAVNQDLSQNLLVVRKGSSFVAIADVTREVVHESTQAGETLQWAVDALAAGGGEIVLGRGSFPLKQTFKLSNGIKLRGGGRSSKLRVSGPKAGLLIDGLRDVEIEDLAVVASGDGSGGRSRTGILIDDSGACQVRNVFCAGFADYGIWS
jgi:hypothetical protein